LIDPLGEKIVIIATDLTKAAKWFEDLEKW
jgi:hypothetical protein